MARKIQKKKILTQKNLLEILIFLIKFNLLALPLYLIIFLNFSFPPIQSLLANLITFFLHAFGYNVARKDFTISILHLNKLSQIEISWDCTGWKSLYLLFALALATPVNLIRKIKFLAFVLPLFFLINLFRILSTIIISLSYGFNYFEMVHAFLWRWSLVFLVPLVWFVWIKPIYFEKSNLFIKHGRRGNCS